MKSEWAKVPIESICQGIYDGPHATPAPSDSGAIFLGISNFVNGRLNFSDIRYIAEEDLPKWTKRVTPQAHDIVFSYEATLNLYAIIPEGFRVGDVLISNIRPYFRKIVYCHADCGCSTDVLCFAPKKQELSAHLFFLLYADSFFDFMVAGSKGTKMPRGDKQQIMMYPVYVPSDEELVGFNSLAQPTLKQIQLNREENKRLIALRDTLLPKLMAGEIDI